MCTEFILPQSSGKRISGRSMDFKKDLPWIVSGVPANTKIKAFTHLTLGLPPENNAYEWTTKYAMVGIGGGFNIPGIEDGRNKLVDGLNTEGLLAAALWLPNSVYPKAGAAPGGAKLISGIDIVSWAVSNYASVSELLSDLKLIQAGKPIASGETLAFWDPFQFNLPFIGGNHAPLHFQFHDNTGSSLVMEFRNGLIELTDNTDLGVMTNYPYIDWHRINVENYLSVTNVDTNTGELVAMPLNAYGHGNATMAMSSSATPPARFIRAAKLITFATPWLGPASNSGAQAFAFNVLGNVAVPRLMSIDAPGDVQGDYTQWTIVRDHVQPQLYVRTADGVGTWSISFDTFIGSEPLYVDLTDQTTGTVLEN